MLSLRTNLKGIYDFPVPRSTFFSLITVVVVEVACIAAHYYHHFFYKISHRLILNAHMKIFFDGLKND